MRHYNGFLSVLMIGFLIGCSGCGGGGAIKGGSEDCNNSSVNVGETITVPAAEESATILIGGKPVDPKHITVNEDGTLDILVTTLASTSVDIEVGSGVDMKTLCKNVRILPAVSKDVTPGTPPDGVEGDTIAPTPASPAPAETTPPPPTSDGDEVADTLPLAGATINTFEVKKVTTSSAKFSTWEIKWTVANAKAAFLWGDVFNRDVSDAGLAEGNRCQLIGTGASARYLVTTATGGNINPSLNENDTTDNPKKKNTWYLEGVLCNGLNAGDPRGCPSIEAPSVEDNPDCRIDLKKSDGSVIPTDTIYTRSLIQHGTICLVVQGLDDAWKTTCKGVAAPKAEITMTGSGVSISLTKPTVTVNFKYSNVVLSPVVVGCTPTVVPAANPDIKGGGDYAGECPITGATMKIDLVASGLGAANTDKKSYEIKLGTPTPTLKFYGASPPPDNSGLVTLEYDVERSCQIEEKGGGVVSCGTVPWVKSVTFEEFPEAVTNKTVQALSDVTGTKDATKDYQHTKWTFKVRDFDNAEYKAEATKDFPTEFQILEFNNKGFHYNFAYDICGWTEDCEDYDCCNPDTGCGCRHDSDDGVWNCRDYVGTIEVAWSVRNIQQVDYHCWGEGNNAADYKGELPDLKPYKYGTQTGVWKPGAMGGEKINCDFTAIKYSGDQIKEVGFLAWRGGSWCDGPDADD